MTDANATADQRARTYRDWDRDDRINHVTDFFGAAARVSGWLSWNHDLSGRYMAGLWLNSLGDRLYQFNLQQRAGILNESLNGVSNAPRNTANANMVRAEQAFVQSALDALLASDRDLYRDVVRYANFTSVLAALAPGSSPFEAFHKRKNGTHTISAQR